MSPEHHGGGLVDARSDQFSCCVALFEALAGERPFRGESLAELAAASVRGEIDASAAARVPPRIRRVLMVGLAVDPTQRFASMDELVAALARARRPRWPIAVGIAGAIAIASAAWLARGQGSDDPCEQGTAIVRQVWNDDSRASIQLARGELTAGYTERVQQRMLTALDDYAASWAELSDEVCRAGPGRARADDPLAQQRAACVDDRLAVLAGVVELGATQSLPAARVDDVLASLPRLDDCRRDDAAAWEPVPDDVDTATKVAALRQRLREANLRVQAGKVIESIDEVEAIAAAARETGFAHVIAEALKLLATVENQRGHPDRSAKLYDESFAIALAAGHDRLAGWIAVERIRLASNNPMYDRETEHWAAVARALFERVGGDLHATGVLHNTFGGILFNRGDHRGALAEQELASAALREALGTKHILYASAEVDCATMLAALGRTEDAWTRATAAMAIIDERVGHGHLEAQRALSLLGLIEEARGNSDSGIAMMYEALDSADEVFGPHSRQVSTVSFNLVFILCSHGRIDEARSMLARSRAAWPVGDDTLAEAQFAEADAWVAATAGESEAALQHIDRAIRIYPQHATEYSSQAGNAALIRAGILLELGRSRDALDGFEGAYRRWAQAHFYGTHWLLEATIAADTLGDRVAVALWLARMEARLPLDESDALAARLARAVANGDREAPRRDRDRLAEVRFPGYPLVRLVDAWLNRTAG
jgi:tetratricopeptide (TPR) repeat protein